MTDAGQSNEDARAEQIANEAKRFKRRQDIADTCTALADFIYWRGKMHEVGGSVAEAVSDRTNRALRTIIEMIEADD